MTLFRNRQVSHTHVTYIHTVSYTHLDVYKRQKLNYVRKLDLKSLSVLCQILHKATAYWFVIYLIDIGGDKCPTLPPPNPAHASQNCIYKADWPELFSQTLLENYMKLWNRRIHPILEGEEDNRVTILAVKN